MECSKLNTTIIGRFYSLSPDQYDHRSHLFEGRYENIYVSEEVLPELHFLKALALKHASEILHVAAEEIQCTCWFNDMGPGHMTLPHTHDDNDELLSGVYYVTVPENSGKLLIWDKDTKVTIEPEPATFVFFSPDKRHEVTKNNSSQRRLSIAFNFGLKLKV